MDLKPLHELVPGEVASIGNKIYAKCAKCMKLIRLNKPFIGSMHLCVEDMEEKDIEK